MKTTQKWICKKCGNQRTEQPAKNEVCQVNGCTGRMIRHRLCKCGKWFTGSRKFCSDECAGIKRTHKRIGKVIVKCDFCGETIVRYAADVHKRNFCRIGCQREYEKTRKEERVCKQCGKIFSVSSAAIEKTNTSGNYCSRECYWQSMRKDRAEYQGFRIAKKTYFVGRQFCAVCGTTKNIQIHHIIPNRLTTDQRKVNLIPLCSLHHNRIERMTATLHELFKDDYGTEQWMLNNILRSRQLETALYIRDIKHGRFKDRISGSLEVKTV